MRCYWKGKKTVMDVLGSYDVVVIGAGHAGIEAAHAAAMLGARTAVFTVSLDFIGNMPCNPSIGGTAKGHLVRELDALGGVMGLAADATFLQSRMLNRGKGPAVHSLRVQTDRKRYHMYMKHALELTPGLEIHQAEITGLDVKDGAVCGVFTGLNGYYACKCVVIATGTTLGGRIHVGEAHYDGGPDGQHAATKLTENLRALGLPIRRFKTGTPARVHRRSIDFSQLTCQPGDPDESLQPFSFLTRTPMHNKVNCYIAYTNPATHKVILDNLGRSPLYAGIIHGVGPRYCPSIEDKVVRFQGKDRHPIFVEPCGEDTEEMYLQGMSSCLPEVVQNEMYRTIRGFEHLEIMRPAYAIEYDCVDPTSLEPTLQSKVVRGMFGAGQFNGTSGYEEAAAQGLLAGLNAARCALGKSMLVLPRHSSYLGTLVDDLVTKGVMDPYRMMTSRSEYRLSLRQDNADERLTPIGREYGLVQDDRWAVFCRDREIKENELARLRSTRVRMADLRRVVSKVAGAEIGETGGTAEELLRRTGVRYEDIAAVIGRGADVTPTMALHIETEIRYAGYIAREQRTIREVQRHENVHIPPDFEYAALETLTLEAREKLAKIRPLTLAQAGRIPGVSPSDVAQLSIALLRWQHEHKSTPAAPQSAAAPAPDAGKEPNA
jgi:tRNA uridine 5-carboxymethylaminomethyl modification enzyme